MESSERKPIYAMDVFPSASSFGLSGFIIFMICFIISILLYLRTDDVWLFILCQFLVLGGAHIGRNMESRHHKRVMGHMSPEFQRLYKDVAYALAKHEVEESKKPVVEKDEQTQEKPPE